MRRIDEAILDRVFQPIADRLNRMGISHLVVARWLVMGFIVVLVVSVAIDVIMFGMGPIPAIFSAGAIAFLYYVARRATREIERDRSRQESGNMAVPMTRERDRLNRVSWAFLVVFVGYMNAAPGSHPNPELVVVGGDILYLLGIYLWATYPQRPVLRHRLAFAGGAA